MLVLPGQRQRAKSSSVIRPFQRDQPALRLAARAMSRQPRQLDRSFDRLGSAVREKRAVQSRERAQLLRQRPLILVVVEIRNVHQLRRLIANRLHDPRMRVPQRIHAQPGNEIQIALALDVVEKHALAPAQHDGIAVISLQQKLPLTFGDLFKGIHRKFQFYRILRGRSFAASSL